MKKIIVLFFITFGISIFMFSQMNNQNHLAKFEEKSTLILEGILTGKESVWLKDSLGNNKHIITLHTFKIYNVLKGYTNTKEVIITTYGGQIGEIGQSLSHSFDLANNIHGIIYLKDSRYLENCYEQVDAWSWVYAHKMNNKLATGRTYTDDFFSGYKKILNPKYYKVITDQEESVKLDLKFDYYVDIENRVIKFAIDVKSNIPNFSLSELVIELEAPKNSLVQNMINKGNISLHTDEKRLGSNYNLTYNTHNENSFNITLNAPCRIPRSRDYFKIVPYWESIIYGVITIDELTGDVNLKKDDIKIQATAKYVTKDGSCYDFETDFVKKKRTVKGHNCAVESKRTEPYAAGIGQIITLIGTGFEDGGQVYIPKAESDTDDFTEWHNILSFEQRWIKSWNDTIIQILISSIPHDVPDPMASGRWVIQPWSGGYLCCGH